VRAVRTAFHADLEEPKANIAWMARLAGQLTDRRIHCPATG
jgi:hypothetical protein